MWKYVTRRIRDTFERSANHFDRRSATGVVNNTPGNFGDERNKQPCCNWFSSRKCWNSSQSDNDTNSNKWSFEHLHKSWIDAITWSGGLVLGWYTSQLIHINLKRQLRVNQKHCLNINDLYASIKPFAIGGNKKQINLKSPADITRVLSEFTPTVHLISNDRIGSKDETSAHSGSSTSQNSSEDDFGEVLNSIENKLGLAAIENGQYQDGLSMLRSAANRNHAPAMYNLGICYENGLGVSANEKMAMELYKSAAALKHPGALYNLGIFYGQGRGGLKIDHDTATCLLRLAAVQGQQDAINALKALEVPISEPPRNKINTWTYQQSPFLLNDNFVPTQSRLFIDHLNYMQVQAQ